MKKVFCLIMAAILTFTFLFTLTACGKSEPFTCSSCGKTISDGKKHTVTDSYGDKWDYCDDCYKQLQDMKKSMAG